MKATADEQGRNVYELTQEEWDLLVPGYEYRNPLLKRAMDLCEEMLKFWEDLEAARVESKIPLILEDMVITTRGIFSVANKLATWRASLLHKLITKLSRIESHTFRNRDRFWKSGVV